MEKFSFWQRWLFIVSLVVAAFGTFMALFNQSSLFAIFNHQIDPIFWDSGIVPDGATRFQGWSYGVLGATTAGWGIFMAFMVRYPFKKRERWAWNCLVVGLLFWYLLDTGISLAYGVVFNALFNSAILIAVALPIVFTKQYFEDRIS